MGTFPFPGGAPQPKRRYHRNGFAAIGPFPPRFPCLAMVRQAVRQMPHFPAASQAAASGLGGGRQPERRFYPGDIFGVTSLALPIAGAGLIDRFMLGRYLDPPSFGIVDPLAEAQAKAKLANSQSVAILPPPKPEEVEAPPVGRAAADSEHTPAWWQYAAEPSADSANGTSSTALSNPWDDGGSDGRPRRGGRAPLVAIGGRGRGQQSQFGPGRNIG